MTPDHRAGLIGSAGLFLLGLLVLLGSDPGTSEAQGKKKAAAVRAPDDLNELSMEVNALRTLYLLRGTDPDLALGTQNPEQRLILIKNKYAGCAQKDAKREPGQASDAYRKTLAALREALVAEHEDRVEELDKKLQELQHAENPDLDDDVEITDEARQKAGLFVRDHCSADQVVGYLAAYGQDLPNPRTLLFKAMRVTPKRSGSDGPRLTPEQWQELRAFTIREVTWQVGGLNVDKGDRVAERVGDLLDRAYAMSEDDLKTSVQKLRNEARALVDKVGPTNLIKHVIERDVAGMLSNPRLVPGVKARLQYLAAKHKEALPK